MGVSITAYETIELVEDHRSPNGFCELRYDADGNQDHDQAYVYDVFTPSAAGLELLNKKDVIRYGRCYRFKGQREHVGFSYGGYGMFRKALCKAAYGVGPKRAWGQPETYSGHPFWLMINFADNEGWIGPHAAAQLAGEFEENADRVKTKLREKPVEPMGWGDFTEEYDTFTRLFRLAADTGAVVYS